MDRKPTTFKPPLPLGLAGIKEAASGILLGVATGKHMIYAVKEIYPTLQGEDWHVGWAALFCRFAG